MTQKNTSNIEGGTVHELPHDIQEVLLAHPEIIDTWNALTPLARNEWICWVTIVKKPETKAAHIERLYSDISDGKRDRAVGQDAHIIDLIQQNGFERRSKISPDNTSPYRAHLHQ